jgi:hypothetical protein
VPISQLAKEVSPTSLIPNLTLSIHSPHKHFRWAQFRAQTENTETEERREKQRRKLQKLEHKKKIIPFSFALSRSKGTKTK